MARGKERLTDRDVRAKGVGVHADGGNLYLQVTEGASGLCKSWLFRVRYRQDGRERQR